MSRSRHSDYGIPLSQYGIPLSQIKLKPDYANIIVTMFTSELKHDFEQFARDNNYDLNKSYEKTVAETHYVLKHGYQTLIEKIINEKECEGKPRFHWSKQGFGINTLYVTRKNYPSLYSQTTVAQILKKYMCPICETTSSDMTPKYI